MDFDLSEEHSMIRDMCRDFTAEVIVPRAEEIERTGEYPYDIMSRMKENPKSCGLSFPGDSDFETVNALRKPVIICHW